MIINLSSQKDFKIVEEKIIKLNKLTVNRVVDFPSKKVAKCFIEELANPITLWEGVDYDNAGQWTDSDVEDRLLELFN